MAHLSELRVGVRVRPNDQAARSHGRDRAMLMVEGRVIVSDVGSLHIDWGGEYEGHGGGARVIPNIVGIWLIVRWM